MSFIVFVLPFFLFYGRQMKNYKGGFYKLALLDFELIFEVKMQESEGV